MTSTNINPIDQSVTSFQRLPIDEQLATLGRIYTEIQGSIAPAIAGMKLPGATQTLFHQVKQLRSNDQLQFLRDVLADQQTENDTVALDIHPTKAMLEVMPGAVTPPLTQYRELDTNARLAFWYQLAQEMGKDVIQMPPDSSLSAAGQEVLRSLKRLDFDQQVDVLRQLV